MKLRLVFSLIFLLASSLLRAQVLEGLAGNAQLQREAEIRFMDGLKSLMLDKQDEAAVSFEKSLDLNPSNAAAHFKLAEIQAERNQYSEALKHLSEAVRLEPRNHFYLELLAEVQDLSGEWKSAIKTWRKIAALPDQDPERIRLSVARIYIDQKKYKDAINELNQCQKEIGPTQDLYQFRINLYLKQNDLKAAIAEGEEMIKAFPEDPESRASLCRILISNEKFSEAKKQTLELLNRFPDFAAAHLMLADIFLQEKNEKAAFEELCKAFASPDLPSESKIEIVAGYLRGALSPEEQEQAMELCDILVKTHPGEARPFIVRGDVLNQAGKASEAREMYLIARQRDRNNFALWEQLVLIDLRLNQIDSLVNHSTEAMMLFPNTASFSFYNGMALLMQKKYEPATQSLEQAGRIALDNPSMQREIYSQLGDAYYNLKQLDKSFSNYEEALALDSADAHVLNNYSYFLSLEKTRLEKAVKLSSRLVALFPDNATYMDTHGWVLYQTSRYSESLVYLEKASRASGSGVIWEHYGDALFRNGRESDAEAAWKKAQDLGGGTSPDLPAKIRDRKVY